MDTNKILEQFHYFNIQADIDTVYGNWAVSTDGDVVNCLYPYAILAIHLKDNDWMAKMKTKVYCSTVNDVIIRLISGGLTKSDKKDNHTAEMQNI